MKKWLSFALLPAVLSSIVPPLLAQDANPLDAKQILQELQDLQTKQKVSQDTLQKRNLDLVFKSAASKETAIALYEDAIMATQFQGANRENTQFRDWKKSHEEQLKNNDFRESVRLHLFYLGLTLKKAAGAKPAELVPQIADYIRVLNSSDGPENVRDSQLRKSVNDGLFASWLGLGPTLAEVKDWEMNPGKSDQIAEKYLLPEWRKSKDPALLAYWDARIALQSQAASGGLDFQEKNVATIRKPQLLWQKSQEYLALDQPNRAVQEMFALIKAYPTHPDVGQWIEKLKGALQPAGKKE